MLKIKDRCIRAEQALAAYSDDDPATNLVDFLADAMHWCRVEGHDFAALLDTAEMHFETEMIEEKGLLP
jgi:hypothetical protein